MSEESGSHGYDVLVAALARLRFDDVAATEFLVLREVATWVFSDQNPGEGYDRSHASLLGGTLFAGVDDAPGIELNTAPQPSEAILASRRRIVDGAHELAALGTVGIDIVVEARLVPSMLGELERHIDDPETQARWAYIHLLYALACGARRDQDADVMRGIIESFDTWTALFADAGAAE